MQEGKKQRIEFLDYLKAVCVIMVIITHYGWEDKTSPFFYDADQHGSAGIYDCERL